MDKVIFHIDVNSAFLSWEACYRVHILGEKQDLRDIASAVGGDVKKRHGIILAKSMPAKKYGVRTGDTIADALKLCPHLVTVPPHYDLYDTCSKAFIEILHEYAPIVEPYSIDEAYCDMSGTMGLFGSPVTVAHLIKDRIRDELGFTVNVGVSSNKLLAKMAGDFKKPDLVHTLFPGEVKSKMWPLPVGDLLFVGHATKRKLNNLGIHTIGDLARTDLDIVRAHFGKVGEVLYAFANGIDVAPVINEAPANKGYGNSSVIPFDVDRPDVAKMILLSLADTVCTRLRADNVMATVVAVSIVDFLFHSESHQMTLFGPTNITNKIHKAACQLFDELWDGITPVRNLGIHTSRIVPATNEYQLNLFDMEQHEKLCRIDNTVDDIRARYGKDSLMRAVFVDNPVYHMSGGISPNKKRPKYETGILE
jgi:DNA polymerase-4